MSGQVTWNSPGAHVGILPAQGVRLHKELECAHDVRRLLRAERSVSAEKAPSTAPAPGPSRPGSKATLRWHRNWPPAATWDSKP